MKNTSIIIVIVIAIACLLAFYIHQSNNRYYISASEKGVSYKIDKRTGKTWLLRGGKLQEVENPEPEKPTPPIRSFPLEERFKVTGNAGLYMGTDLYRGTLHNGSQWCAKEILITVTAKNIDGSTRWSRQYKDDISIDPLSTGIFQIELIGIKDTSLSWVINEVRGYPIAEQ